MTAPALPRAVERASLARYLELLDSRGDRYRQRGDHIDARCPAHDDTDPSLSADWRPADAAHPVGRVVVCCQVGCSQDAVREAYGLSSWRSCTTGLRRTARGG